MPTSSDQPDWQRYQSSSGPPLWVASGVGPLSSGIMYVGPWRSYFLYASNTAGLGVYTLTVTWSTDAAGANVIFTDTIIVGNQVPRYGWRPMLAAYMSVSATHSHVGTGDALTLTIVPSLLESLIGGNAITRPMISQTHDSVAALSVGNFYGAYSMGGRCLLDLAVNHTNCIIWLYSMAGDGTWVSTRIYQPRYANLTYQWEVTLPDAPVYLAVENDATDAYLTFDVHLVLS